MSGIVPRVGERVAARILIAEDDPDTRTALELLLRDHDYDVVAVPNGAEALARLAEGPRPDLLLLDMMMPGTDGEAVVRALRERGDTIPIVVLTAFPVVARPLDVTMRLEKPVDAQVLLDTIASTLGSPRD